MLAAAGTAPEGTLLTLADALAALAGRCGGPALAGAAAAAASREFADRTRGRVSGAQAAGLLHAALTCGDAERLRAFVDDFAAVCQGRLAPAALHQYGAA